MPKDEKARCPYEATCPFAIAINAQDVLRKGIKMALPEAFRQHLLGAEREALLAVRSLIDALLEAVEKKPAKGKAQRIRIE